MPRSKDHVLLLVGLLAAGMAGQTRFTDGLRRGPGWLDVVFLIAIGVVLVVLGRTMAKMASRVVDAHIDADHGPGFGKEWPRPAETRPRVSKRFRSGEPRGMKKRRSK